LISHDEIANMNAEDITDVVLTQAIVGGCY